MPSLVPDYLPEDSMSRTPQPTLKVDELTLRPFTEADQDAVVDAYDDPDMVRYHMRSVLAEDYESWFTRRRDAWGRNSAAYWAVERDGKVLASTGFREIDLSMGFGEMAYWVHRSARGQGLASRPLRRVVQWAFEDLGLHKLELCHSTSNPASGGVAAAAGFTPEGVCRSGIQHDDGWHDMRMWGIVNPADGPAVTPPVDYA